MSATNRHYFVIISLFGGASIICYLYLVRDITSRARMIEESCPVRAIVTVEEGGRLGNVIWEYASTVAIGRFLNFSPYVPRSILKCLQDIFQNLTVPAYEDSILSERCRMFHGGNTSHCRTPRSKLNAVHASPWDFMCNSVRSGRALRVPTALSALPDLREMYNRGEVSDVIVLPRWIMHTEAVSKLGLKKFRQLFRIRPDIMDLVKNTTSGVLEKWKGDSGKGEEVSFVGVHVRRTDYIAYLKAKFRSESYVGAGYFHRAMAKMRKLLSGTTVLFLVVSDDRGWCVRKLVNESAGVFWGGMEKSPFHSWAQARWSAGKRRAHDLALLATLNATIISYGSFGASGALLAGGHTIAFNLTTNTTGLPPPATVRLAKLLNSWELMN